eukprot:3455322-Karenia_brevis.AAC.1
MNPAASTKSYPPSMIHASETQPSAGSPIPCLQIGATLIIIMNDDPRGVGVVAKTIPETEHLGNRPVANPDVRGEPCEGKSCLESCCGAKIVSTF